MSDITNECETVHLQVDGKVIEARQGSNLLKTCLDHGVYIPSLCGIGEGVSPAASCRLCFVNIEGELSPLPACTVTVDAPLSVRTDTARVRRLQRSAFKLLLSVHHVDCRNCPANKQCELQRMARFLKVGLKSKPLPGLIGEVGVDSTHPVIDIHPYRCVLCGRCIAACRNQRQQPMLTFAGRGFDTKISAYGAEMASAEECAACRACVDVCPVAALTIRKD